MPARSTPTRRPASSPRSRSGSTASGKRAPAKRTTAGNRRPAAKKKSNGGLLRIVGGSWTLLARGPGALAGSTPRREEAEPLGPEHRRDGVGLAVLGLAVVLGAAVWTNGIGPVGAGIPTGAGGVGGPGVLLL